MLIAIPTYGRAAHQRTLHNIPASLLPKVWLVVQQREAHAYRTYGIKDSPTVVVLPDHIRTIAPTRDWLIQAAAALDQKLVMLDDDLDFAARRLDDPTKFLPACEADMHLLFSRIETLLDSYVHVGVSAREGANRNTENFLYNTRMMRVLGYRPKILREEGVKFDNGVGLMEDFHVTLRLLMLGFPNAVVNSMVHNQPGSNVAGGCSEFRTPERQKQAAESLAAAFPDFVTVVKKQTKSSWNGEERYDVRIQWKRAYQCGGTVLASEVLDRGEGDDTQSEGAGATEAVV